MWETIERTLTAKHYDVVHFFGGFQVYEYRKAVRDLPNIIVPYDSYALFMRRAISRPTGGLDWFRLQAASLLAHQYERTIYAAFDRTILVSAKDEEYLHHLSPDLNTRVIPSGVDSQYFKPANSIVRTPTLVFVGNYDYPPNTAAVGMLVNAILPRVKLEIPEARATLVGPNPPPWLTALAGDAVEVTGYVQDVRPYLARAACFVAPLTLGSGMRNKILEAMAMGLPVVSTPIGCEGIAVTDGQDVLLGQSPEELARAAISVLQDRGLWEQIAQGGLQLVRQRYNWHKVGAQYEKLYHEVIAEHHS
jgi:glycosyltransferase involved in cell wall biosynthesis